MKKIDSRIKNIMLHIKPLLGIFSLLFVFNTNKHLNAQTPTSPQIFNSGSGTFTVPCGVTSITVQVWGGGGGGASDGTNNATAGGAGGSGGYVSRTIAVTPGNTFTYTVGAGGAAASAGANSTFVNGTGPATNMIAGGGGAGIAEAGGGGAGGSASGGATNTSGTAGANSSGTTGGTGGTNVAAGSGAGGAGGANGVNGTVGNAPGGGGGGSGNRSGGGNVGGAGGAGRITISFAVTSAGTNQTLAACATTTTMAATVPSAGTGTWTCVSGCTGVVITTPTSATSGVTGLTPGTPTVLRWTVTNAGCTTTTSDVIITPAVGPLCPTYCAKGTMNCTLNDGLTNVTFGGINANSTACANGSASCLTVITGNSYSFSATSGTGTGTHSLAVYIDWNSNGSFADAGEFTLLANNNMAASSTVTGSFAVPGTATCGATIRMRVLYVWSTPVPTSASSCSNFTYGETEDYCLVVSCCVGTCSDGIQNCGETGIDCGGPCAPCALPAGTCFDGIMNGTETGIDCGGSCALACSTNNANPDGSSNCGACPPAAVAVVYPTVCAQVGTSAYNLNSPNVNFTSCASFASPSPLPTCAPIGTLGTWIHVDLAPGVTQVQLAFNSGTVANGNNNTWAAPYQGTGCGALTAVPGGCQNSVYFVSGTQYVNQVFFTGLDPNQDLWIFMFNDAGKTFNLNYSLIGTAGAPSNTTCGTSSTAIGSACNLGAPGATFTTPGAAGQGCTGGSWGSNENTTFYSFTATATTASLTIGGITCNSGTSGNAQFAVWNSCAAVGTYGAGFLGCAVGTGTINLTGLTAGQTYYIASDGFAGDNCKWNFTGNNIVLPIELISFDASYENESVILNWATASESNNDYFTIERTINGVDFEYVATVKGAGNSTSKLEYDAVDVNPLNGLSYYRLKQTDFDGKFKYTELVAVRNNNEIFNVYPNPAGNNIEISFNTNTTEDAELKIIDVVTGKLVISQQISPKKGMNVIQLNTSNLSNGLYFVTLTNKFEQLKTKFIKQ